MTMMTTNKMDTLSRLPQEGGGGEEEERQDEEGGLLGHNKLAERCLSTLCSPCILFTHKKCKT